MIEKFRLLFVLLDLAWNDEYIAVAQWIVDHPDTKILASHPYEFAFQGFAKYVAGNMSEEDFLALGDISSSQVLGATSPVNPALFMRSVAYGVATEPTTYANSLIVVAKVPGLSIDSFVQKQISAVGSAIFLI
ncbi:MAG: hypothetical protein WCO66_04635 [Candidatus Absconditabacteria bacterium]